MEKYIIPQAKAVKPFRQGQLDTLCGLYSAINAIRLASYPKKHLTKYHARIMMEEGLDYLAKRQTRLLCALTDGMSNKLRLALTRHLVKFVNDEWDVGLELINPEIDKAGNLRLIITSFIESNVKAHRPVCININGHHKHYTVIVGYNPRSYMLHDSDGLKSIQRSLIGIGGDRKGVRHILSPNGVFAII